MPETLQITDSLTIPQLKLRINFEADATPDQAMRAIDTLCGALSRQESSVEHLRILLGRMMAEVKDKKLYQPEYSSFEDFTKAVVVKHRLSRSTVRDSIMIVRRLPMLEPEQAESIPITNITLAARAAKGMNPKAIRGILKSAARMSVADFREEVETAGLVRKGPAQAKQLSPSKIVLRIVVGKPVAQRWHALVGQKDPGRVLSSLLSAAEDSQAMAA